ncbi:MAG: hypothetical protein RSB14_05845 [Kiritimatiellia bacterium]
MADGDTRRWSLRNPSAEISNNNIPTAMLVQWASQGIVKPGYTLSTDGISWVPAETLPELNMTWYILAPERPPYGPITQVAAEKFIAEALFPRNSVLSQNPGDQPVSIELPLHLVIPEESHQQEVEETRKRLVLLEKELRIKDRRINELRQEAEMHQSELNVDNIPDAKTLAAELEQTRLEYAHLKASAQEAEEASAQHERELRQRIHTLDTALEKAQSTLPPEAPPDETLFAILSKEAELLRQGQEEEQRLLDQIRELARMRLVQLSERLRDICKLTGDTPLQMRENIRREGYIHPITVVQRSNPTGNAELEKSLSAALARESALQKQLISLEARETELRTKVGQAERQTLDSLTLDEKLRETAKALERERHSREEEHRENAHIQEQLLRRIEELERNAIPATAPILESPSVERPASNFGWLRKK